MQNHDHPHDERLAALAGGDPEAAADSALRAHVSPCDRCGPLLDELAVLRAALAELPDLVPGRRIQLIPPVPAETPRQGIAGWLRTLAGPVMAAGAGLALVGAVGLGSLAMGGLAAGGAIFQNVGTNLEGGADPDTLASSPLAPDAGDNGVDRSSAKPEDYSGQSASPVPVAGSGDEGRSAGEKFALIDTGTPLPWLTLVLFGAALLVIGLVLRFTIRPRAG